MGIKVNYEKRDAQQVVVPVTETLPELTKGMAVPEPDE